MAWETWVFSRSQTSTIGALTSWWTPSMNEWLTVFLLPAHSPDLNPVEWVLAHVKRSLANLAVVALDPLETLVRDRLKPFRTGPAPSTAS